MRFTVFGMLRTALLAALAGACARPGAPPAVRPIPGGEESRLPPVPLIEGPLDLRVVYPPAGSVLAPVDSSFLFGSVGNGRATLSINGYPVRVWPNGSWLAWIPFPRDSMMDFELEAHVDGQARRLVHSVRRAQRFVPRGTLWVDTTSFDPRGQVWWPRGEVLPIDVRASAGASLRLLLPDGRAVPLGPVSFAAEVPPGIRAFDRDPVPPLAEPRWRYIGGLIGATIGPEPGPPDGPAPAPRTGPDPILEAVRGPDTLRVPWPLSIALLGAVPPVVEVDNDPEGRGATDGITVGRALPGGTYHWFFPAGTRAVVKGRIGADLRLALSATSEAWVAARETRALFPGVSLPRAVIGSITATPVNDRQVVLRVPSTWRVPYRVDETAHGLVLRLYRAAGDPDWIRYGKSAGPLRLVTWDQPTGDEMELRVELALPLWGYRVRWDHQDLLLEIRAAPAIDPRRPLQGRLVVVDPGHPPGGATGPGGYYEGDANLAVARALRELLVSGGATVVLTRNDDQPLDLRDRVRLADTLDADLLVSIHNNALPDGVNPFTSSGSSVFYFHPRSLSLARAVQEGLVGKLGLRDLGVGRGDLALVRGTWMPSILAEGLFMMLPDHEAALRDPRGRQLYAEAVRDGIVRFLDWTAGGPGAGLWEGGVLGRPPR